MTFQDLADFWEHHKPVVFVIGLFLAVVAVAHFTRNKGPR